MESAPEIIRPVVSEEYIAVDDDAFVEDAVEKMRSFSPRDDATTVYYVYVTDENDQLVGVVSTRQLLNAEPDTVVSELMESDVIDVKIDDDPEDVANLIRETDFPALPAVDNGKLVGVIRADDIVDVMEEEATEDMFKRAGFAGIEADRSLDVLESSIGRILQLRLPWLIVALAGGLLAALVIGGYEEELEAVTALAFFIPVIMDMGGNVGTQASTIFVRGLAVGHIDDRNAMRHFAREGLIGGVIGLIVGFLGAAGAYLWQGVYAGNDFAPELTLVVFVSLVAVCVIASVVGYVIPWIIHKLGYDPAAASDPLITTVKDVTALIIYFSLAAFLLAELI